MTVNDKFKIKYNALSIDKQSDSEEETTFISAGSRCAYLSINMMKT